MKVYDDNVLKYLVTEGSGKSQIGSPANPLNRATSSSKSQKNSQSIHFNKEVLDLITKKLHAQPQEIVDVSELKRGMTNYSFKFYVRGESYIIRIPGEGTQELINRRQEYEVYEQLKGHHISDEVIYISPDKGYKLTKYIEDSRVCDPFSQSDVNRCMKKLRAFHHKKLIVAHTFDLFEKIDFYESLWGGKASIFEDYAETKKKIQELKKIIEEIPKECSLTHIDAVPNNFLLTKNDTRLIDWEYAGMQDPHLDIAMFAIYSFYDEDQIDQLIDFYFIEGCSETIRKKIYCYIAVSGLLWSNWCEYKRFVGIDFDDYGFKKYHYAKKYYKIVKDNWLEKEAL